MKTWFYKEFVDMNHVTSFANVRKLMPGEILFGPPGPKGTILAMYFAEKP